MIRVRSTRDRERIDYESGEAVRALRDAATYAAIKGDPIQAARFKTCADQLERARNGLPTKFDSHGKRAEWQDNQKDLAA